MAKQAALRQCLGIGRNPNPHRWENRASGGRCDNKPHYPAQERKARGRAAGRQPVLGFEFFSREQSGHLLQYVARKEADETDEKRLRERLGWGPRRDASWPFYFELLEIARSNGLPAFGLDLPRAMRARLQRQGLEGLTAFERSMLPATGFADDAYRRVDDRNRPPVLDTGRRRAPDLIGPWPSRPSPGA